MKIYYQEKKQLIKAIVVAIATIIIVPIFLSVQGFSLDYNEYNEQIDTSSEYQIKFSILDIVNNNDLEICLIGEEGVLLEKLIGTNCVKVAPARELLFNERKVTVYSSQNEKITKTKNSAAYGLINFIRIGYILLCVLRLLIVIDKALIIRKKRNFAVDIQSLSCFLHFSFFIMLYGSLFTLIRDYWSVEILEMKPSTWGKESWNLNLSIVFIVILFVLSILLLEQIIHRSKEKIVLDKSNGNYMFEILETSKYELRLIDILKNNSPITAEDAINLVRKGGCAYNLSRESVEKIHNEFKKYDSKIYYEEIKQDD